MNVLFLNDTCYLGGGELWVRRMAGALVRRGHACQVVAPRGARIIEDLPPGVRGVSYSSITALDFPDWFERILHEHVIQKIVVTPYGTGLEAWQLNEI